jgi:hypothetical protein
MLTRPRLALIPALTVAVLTAAGCSDGGGRDEQDETAASETSSTEGGSGAGYDDVDALVDATAEAGWECATPVLTPQAGDVENTRYCSPVDDPEALSWQVFSDDAELQAEVEEAEAFAEDDIERGSEREPASVLVGSNWLIDGPYAVLETLEPALGGELRDLRGDWAAPACEQPAGEGLRLLYQSAVDIALSRVALAGNVDARVSYTRAVSTLAEALPLVDGACVDLPEFALFQTLLEAVGYQVQDGTAEPGDVSQVQDTMNDWFVAMGLDPFDADQ